MADDDARWWLVGAPTRSDEDDDEGDKGDDGGEGDDDSESPHASCFAAAMSIVDAGRDRIAALALHRALYVDRPVDEEYIEAAEGGEAEIPTRRKVARKNVVAAGVDTMHSRIARGRPRPWVVTQGGDWSAWMRARSASQWLDGLFERRDLYTLGDEIVHDACLWGEGIVMVWEDDTDPLPQIRRIDPACYWTDPDEEAVDHLRTFYLVTLVDREVLAERFPDHAEELRDIAGTRPAAAIDSLVVGRRTGDMVPVVEAWHVSEKHGRHVVCVESCTLHDEKWDGPEPFVRMRYRRDPSSSRGVGLGEALVGTQLDVDELETQIGEAYGRMIAAWMLPNGSMPPERITSQIGAIYLYDPQSGEPHYYTPPPVSPDLLLRAQQQIDSAFDLNGISRMSATMQKPAGVNAAVALQTIQDIESERHLMTARSQERFYVELAKMLLRTASRAVKRRKKDGTFDAEAMRLYAGRRSLKAVEFTSASLDEIPHVVRVFPVSALAQQPGARMQQVNDLWNMGVVDDRAAFLEMLQMPDLDAYSERELSGRWEVDELVDMAIEGADVEGLEVHGYMDHPYLRKRGTQMRAMAKRRGAPDDVLDALSHLIDQADVWIARAQQAAAATAAMAAAPAAANPMPDTTTGA